MAFSFQSNALGAPNITDVTAILPGTTNLPSVVLEPQYGEIRQGWDPLLGSAEFIYLKGVAALVAGNIVQFNALTGVTTIWTGAANTGLPLAVAVSAPTATQTGWFQVEGNAITTVTGTVAAGDASFFSAAGSVKTAATAGKQVLGAVAASANGATIGTGTGAIVLASTQAVYTINRPHVQGQIT